MSAQRTQHLLQLRLLGMERLHPHFACALDAWGIDHVTSLIASSFPVAGPEADAYAKAVVGAMVGSLLQSTKSEVAAAPARRATDRATR